MSNIPSIREKCTGALLASAIGDSLGWPYEFRAVILLIGIEKVAVVIGVIVRPF